jgi:protein-export membrane protein SecD
MSKNNTNKEKGGNERFIQKFHAVAVLAIISLVGFFVYTNSISDTVKYPFKLGLDLAGGSHLVYEADVSKINPAEVPDLMNVLRDVIERRVNVFGVSEPIVQVERGSFVSDNPAERLVVELPGVTDVATAVAEIGKTPLLEFKLVDTSALEVEVSTSTASGTVAEVTSDFNPFIDTGLTGRYLTGASLEFAGGTGGQLSNEPIVSIVFNAEGADLFETITRDHVGENLAIFLDGQMISSPRLNETIVGGRAIISGGFTPEEARDLAQNLNFGALPVPIELVSTQTVGASLGEEVLNKGVQAGLYGLGLIILFMLLWYRLPGLVAGVSLIGYVLIMLALFKLIPVTLTAAGLAGLVLSLGMAVDANVLVFERMKEEYRSGKNSHEAARVGFKRAWSAIRDGNITSLLSAVILFWFGTSIVKGFALVFGLGVVVSMISALLVTRTLLLALPESRLSKKTFLSKLYNSGINKI